MKVARYHGNQKMSVVVRLAALDRPGVSVDVPVMIDTGSSGLRVFKRALPAGLVPDAAPTTTITYSGGNQFHSHVAKVGFTIGDAPSVPIDIEIVDEIGCAAELPHCPAADPKGYFAPGNLVGIMGVGLRPTKGIYSPLAQLPAPLRDRYLLRTQANELEIGVPDDEARAFKTIQLDAEKPRADGSKTWNDEGAPVHYAIGSFQVVGKTQFDSGTSGIQIPLDDATLGRSLAGQPLHAWVPDVFDWNETRHVQINPPSTFKLPFILGSEFFVGHDVLFDAAKGQIGILTLAAAPATRAACLPAGFEYDLGGGVTADGKMVVLCGSTKGKDSCWRVDLTTGAYVAADGPSDEKWTEEPPKDATLVVTTHEQPSASDPSAMDEELRVSSPDGKERGDIRRTAPFHCADLTQVFASTFTITRVCHSAIEGIELFDHDGKQLAAMNGELYAARLDAKALLVHEDDEKGDSWFAFDVTTGAKTPIDPVADAEKILASPSGAVLVTTRGDVVVIGADRKRTTWAAPRCPQ
jgi:hypothetical protein